MMSSIGTWRLSTSDNASDVFIPSIGGSKDVRLSNTIDVRVSNTIDASKTFAAIGILSHGSATQRAWIRESYLSRHAREAAEAQHGLVVRFVLRSIGASFAQQQEPHEHGDVVFISADAKAGRASGPLASLVLWWRHASAAWPSASFIGKADDDVYLHLGGIAMHLRASQMAVRHATGEANPRIYWGAFEAYSYDEAHRAPTNFLTDRPGTCKRRLLGLANSTNLDTGARLHGPFPFARGPLYFLSRELVTQLLADKWVAVDLNTTLSGLARLDELQRTERLNTAPNGRARDGPRREPRMVWEDVYTGYVLSRSIGSDATRGLALVEHGVGNGGQNPVYSDGFGMQLAPTTLIWHMRMKWKAAHRVAFAHHWLEVEGRHCVPPPWRTDPSWVRCGWQTKRAMTTSCTGARWLRCTSRRAAYTASNCSMALTELKRTAATWLLRHGESHREHAA